MVLSGTTDAVDIETSSISGDDVLNKLGVNCLQVMPVAEFAGDRSWGYNPAHVFAVESAYGGPKKFKEFIREAHRNGFAVVLDVVYNHLGPDGNYLRKFSASYFTADHKTDWGEAINFYGQHSAPVREFYAANAAYWIKEFHLDGLRLDATQNVYDKSKDHILAEINRSARKAAGQRAIIVVAENEPQDATLIRPEKEGGYGFDGLWNDDFHHSATVALTGSREAYFGDYLGSPQELLSSLKYGFLYQGQWYSWQKQRRGTPTLGSNPAAMVTFLQNHDQIANSLTSWVVVPEPGLAVLLGMAALGLVRRRVSGRGEASSGPTSSNRRAAASWREPAERGPA
jgi:maltooligosyltrehalose trehalohydrolase